MFSPKSAYMELFDNRKTCLTKSISFAFVSVMLSFSILILADNFLRLGIGLEIKSIAQYMALIPIQFVIVVPIFAGLLMIISRIFHGKGSLKDSASLIFYSFFLSPYATFVLVLFLFVENMMGFPLSINPPPNKLVAFTELIIESMILMYGFYIFARGVEVGHKVNFIAAFKITTTLAVLTILFGYSMSLVLNDINFS